jgi:hypothetical protein
MICERCGEVAETFFTEQYGELCEACQQAVEQEHMSSPPSRRRLADEGPQF